LASAHILDILGFFETEPNVLRERSVMKINRSIFAAATLFATGCISASAQQTTGVPGSPEATTTITGKQLPPPDPKFKWYGLRLFLRLRRG
jgi:hypothetical protein